jgi:hypothetical protein
MVHSLIWSMYSGDVKVNVAFLGLFFSAVSSLVPPNLRLMNAPNHESPTCLDHGSSCVAV